MRLVGRRVPVTTLATLVLSGMLAGAADAHAPASRSEVEPNNSSQTATVLPLVGGYGVGVGSVDPANDVDYWKFIAPPGSRVWILTDTGGVQLPGATSRDTVVDLLTAGGTVLESDDDDGTANGGDGTVEAGISSAIAGYGLPSGGAFYIRVRGFSPAAIVNPYRLFVVVTSTAFISEIEVNDTAASANPIVSLASIGVRSGSIGSSGDVDYYSVVAKAGDIIYVSADGDPERDGTGTDIVVELRSPADALLLSLDSSGTTFQPAESVNYGVTASGTYFVAIRGADASQTGTYRLMVATSPRSATASDVDNDRISDIGVYRGSTGEWFFSRSIDGMLMSVGWGAPSLGDVPVAADYDGDGQADVAVYRTTTGDWFIRRSSGGSTAVSWGAPALDDRPVPGDYDGDGIADIAVYRNSTGQWFIRYSAGGTGVFSWGAPSLGDIAVPADYDGDGKTDVAIYRRSTGDWFMLLSGGGSASVTGNTGTMNDEPVPADYDGDGRADTAVYRSSTGEWFIRYAAGGATSFSWGAASLGDIPVPADYDGDGKADAAIYRQTSGQWFVRTSPMISKSWGAPGLGDTPIELPSWLR